MGWLVDELGVPAARVALHGNRHGDLGSAATLVRLDEDRRAAAVRVVDRCVLCTVGAGAQYGGLLIEL